ncbi:uncharacterized protein G2W53_003938 [Senna tora]|uniref:Uncharacterized protein n=1 Tax=Senna tora TaxID=362788 RepID=A0A834XBM6_9FABA|nr:uncharacterized protein G2W53_003938 [Senna tora]
MKLRKSMLFRITASCPNIGFGDSSLISQSRELGLKQFAGNGGAKTKKSR